VSVEFQIAQIASPVVTIIGGFWFWRWIADRFKTLDGKVSDIRTDLSEVKRQEYECQTVRLPATETRLGRLEGKLNGNSTLPR
jgi:hypothetical protein